MKKLLVIQVAALGHELLRAHGTTELLGLPVRPTGAVFPAVTCTAQASFRTAAYPSQHGMVANGVYSRELHRPMFWEQSCDLVSGERIWKSFRARGGKVGMLFWQQSLGEDVDVVLSPAPIHKHHGGLVQDCYSRPAGLYAKLCEAVGGKFNLMHYWGPLASPKVGDWISRATTALLDDRAAAPDLCFVYLPSLDYNLQRHPGAHAKNAAALSAVLRQLDVLGSAARRNGYDILIFGDYAIADTAKAGAVFPNCALTAAGLMTVREVAGMEYPDFHAGRAFAMADHEIAHVYVKNAADVPAVRSVLENLPGVAQVLDRTQQAQLKIDHANSGELVLIAAEQCWFAYPWWTDARRAPDYASHIDIHNKPGYDPCELFFAWPRPWAVSQDTRKIRGSHGRIGRGREIAWAASFDAGRPADIVELAAAVKMWLE